MTQYLKWPRRNRYAWQPVGGATTYVRQPSARVDLNLLAMPSIAVAASGVLSPAPVADTATVLDAMTMPSIAATAAVFYLKGTITVTIASPAVFTYTAHGFANGQILYFTTTGSLPTGLTAGVWYYVVNTAANTFQVSTSLGGAAVTTTGTQSGTHTCYYKV